MPARPFPWKCATCRERAVQPVTVDYTTDMQHDGQVYSIMVPSLEILRCERCGTQLLSDDAHETLVEALRRKIGLLTPSEIRHYRLQLGLTEQQLAD